MITKEEFIQHHIFTEQILRKKSILKYFEIQIFFYFLDREFYADPK